MTAIVTPNTVAMAPRAAAARRTIRTVETSLHIIRRFAEAWRRQNAIPFTCERSAPKGEGAQPRAAAREGVQT